MAGHTAVVQLPSSKGPLAPELSTFTYPPHSDLPSVGTFRTQQSKFSDPTTFLVNFRERLRLFGYPDAVLCQLFLTCLEGLAWDWYVSLPKGSIPDFATLTQRFLARFETIKKSEITYDSLLSIKQGPREPTRQHVNRFVESAYRVSDFDDKIAVLALRKGLLKCPLRFEACKHVFPTLREFVTFANAYIQGKEDAYSFEEDKRSGYRTPPRQNYNGRGRQNRRGRQPHSASQPPNTSRYLPGTGESRQPIYNTYHSLRKPREKIL
jgi:Retrotransposon gag protein